MMFAGYTVTLEQHWHFKRVKGKDLLLLTEEWGSKSGVQKGHLPRLTRGNHVPIFG